MIKSFLDTVKNFFGIGTEIEPKRKRSIYRLDFNVSADEDSDSGINTPKRRKLDLAPEPAASQDWTQSSNMASWIKFPKGFNDRYYVRPTSTKKIQEDPEIIDLSDEDEKHEVQAAAKSQQRKHHAWSINKQPTGAQAKVLPAKDTHSPVSGLAPMTNGRHKQTPFVYKNGLRPINDGQRSSRIQKPQFSVPSYSRYTGKTVNECIRLEEREQYKQLLQNYKIKTGQSILGYTPTSILRTANLSSDARVKPVVKERLTDMDRKYYTRRILTTERKPRPLGIQQNGDHRKSVAVVDVSVGKKPVDAKPETVKVLGEDSAESQSDNSVVYVGEVVPKWRQTVQSMQGLEYSQDWLKEWRAKLIDDYEAKSKRIKDAELTCRSTTVQLDSFLSNIQKELNERLTVSEKVPEVIEEIFLEKEEEAVEPLYELTAEMEECIENALRPNPPEEVLVEAFHLQIRRRDMETLQDLNWLNDEVINFYMSLLVERGKLDNMLSVYTFNTFFYPRLLSGGHPALKRWTRKVDIFSYDIVLVPVHLGVHWCLAVVDFQNKTIKYYDSMGGTNNECLNALCEYLKAERQDKKKQPFDMTEWKIINEKDIPQQMNSSDCGMFACKYAEYITRNSKITFKQEHMPYFRRRMVYEILNQRLL